MAAFLAREGNLLLTPLSLALAVMGLLFLDGLTFCELFVSGGLYDPLTVNLPLFLGFLPR